MLGRLAIVFVVVVGLVALSRLDGKTANALGGSTGAFVATWWPYLLVGTLILLLAWGILERIFRN